MGHLSIFMWIIVHHNKKTNFTGCYNYLTKKKIRLKNSKDDNFNIQRGIRTQDLQIRSESSLFKIFSI